MPRPIIGLTTYAEDARFGLQDTFSAVLPLSYVHAVHETGGRAVLITPDDPDPEILDGVDGIVFTGGSDVDPALYGDTPHGATRVKPNRDRAELMLLRAAAERGVPLLGICRGMQLMSVAYGGRLHQHLPDVLGHHGHRPATRIFSIVSGVWTCGPWYGRGRFFPTYSGRRMCGGTCRHGPIVPGVRAARTVMSPTLSSRYRGAS